MNFDFSCNIGHIQLDVPHQIWELSTAQGSANPLFVRFLYNKLTFFATNIVRCYTHYLSPEFLNQTYTIFGLVLYLVGVYYLVKNKKKISLTVLLIAPLFPLSELGPLLFRAAVIYLSQIAIMLYGFIKIVKSCYARMRRR